MKFLSRSNLWHMEFVSILVGFVCSFISSCYLIEVNEFCELGCMWNLFSQSWIITVIVELADASRHSPLFVFVWIGISFMLIVLVVFEAVHIAT